MSPRAPLGHRPSSRKAAPPAHLRIDTLRLHGFASEDRDALIAAFQRELSRLVAERGAVSSAPLRIERVRIDGVRGETPEDAGRDAARVLYAKLRLEGGGGGR